jgi:hypothetical protein
MGQKTMTSADVQQLMMSSSITTNTNDATSKPSTVSSGHNKRILKEYSDFVSDPLPGAQVFITENNIQFWKLILEGMLCYCYCYCYYCLEIRSLVLD